MFWISTPLTSTVVTITIVGIHYKRRFFFSSEIRPFTLTVQKQFVTPSGDGGCSFRWSVPFLTKIRKKYSILPSIHSNTIIIHSTIKQLRLILFVEDFYVQKWTHIIDIIAPLSVVAYKKKILFFVLRTEMNAQRRWKMIVLF